jgi:hypothetical protein
LSGGRRAGSAIALAIAVLIVGSCARAHEIAGDGSNEDFRTPDNRAEPRGAASITHAPGDDPVTLVGEWRVDHSDCILELAPLEGAAGEATPGNACEHPWSEVRSWSVGSPPVGTAALHLFDGAGRRIWGGARREDGAYQGQGRVVARRR